MLIYNLKNTKCRILYMKIDAHWIKIPLKYLKKEDLKDS